jgi:hypothetical protein
MRYRPIFKGWPFCLWTFCGLIVQKTFRLLFIFLLVGSAPASAKINRSSSVKADFQRQHPCPSTGRTTGACKGYVKDHIKALDCGGADAVHNLQWQTVADAKLKDKWERKECRR